MTDHLARGVAWIALGHVSADRPIFRVFCFGLGGVHIVAECMRVFGGWVA